MAFKMKSAKSPAKMASLSPVTPQSITGRNDPAGMMNRNIKKDRSKLGAPKKLSGLAKMGLGKL
jgi:hypothetical protein